MVLPPPTKRPQRACACITNHARSSCPPLPALHVSTFYPSIIMKMCSRTQTTKTCFSRLTSFSISISLALALNSDSPFPCPGCSISSLKHCRYSSSRRRSSISYKPRWRWAETTAEIRRSASGVWACLTSCMDSFSFWKAWRLCHSLSIIFL